MAIATINPATGETLQEFEAHSAEEIDRRIGLAAAAVEALRRTTFAERAGWMRVAADLLDADAEELARTMTTEMGKTLAASKAEVAKCAKGMRFYADNAEAFLADEPLDDPAKVNASRAYVAYQPLGVVLAVMPWNFPLWQVIRFAAPALMAGNTGLLKHASNVPQTALYLDTLFTRAGFPEGAFATLLIGSREVERVLTDQRVAAATLTGSEGAGAAVAAIAGRELKKTVLELGGSDPYVVMPSADLAKAAKVAVTARVQNNGQSCIAAKRFIVHTDCYDEFAALFVDAMSALRMGDPMADDTQLGPIATEGGREDVEELVADAVAHGAKVLCGGERPDQPGWWYPATVVSEITQDARMYYEEVFGPVASLFRVPSIDEAIAVANATSFGLGSNAWTEDADEKERFERELAAGAVFVNGMVTSYPELPFGGIKRSGYGRELAKVGIREFCNAKTVWVA
ncbi:NADP-dependent succinic semialdehyde dehydrogenase [Tenggerimyces flavus]|uniref:NADP-dependent succinic semialdehyde dehydrogenase n=1 Tax=Tenggerimyces flavus TaxID=1708749 RepID=A0ABV7YKB8_9ACTN|nr:NADP-dependent succinic semialdehyde dehydrogenase [Tenggerimyces flavus]MBM7784190.1 succinate-semialdehyde dehydrogenase/glutarate-semialdehyde dehydrogenase [Tenggerimyces flavus]